MSSSLIGALSQIRVPRATAAIPKAAAAPVATFTPLAPLPSPLPLPAPLVGTKVASALESEVLEASSEEPVFEGESGFESVFGLTVG